MLTSIKRTSSTCTGVYTAEMALAVIEKTVNDSKVLPAGICMRPVCATAWGLDQRVYLCFMELQCLRVPAQRLRHK